MLEVILVVVGAVLGYLFGWLKEALRRRQERKSVASALSAELVRVSGRLEYLRDRWRGGKMVLELRTPMFDTVPSIVVLFPPASVADMLDFIGYLEELKRMLAFFETDVWDGKSEGQRQRLIKEIKGFCEDVLAKATLVSTSLVDDGAEVRARVPVHELDASVDRDASS